MVYIISLLVSWYILKQLFTSLSVASGGHLPLGTSTLVNSCWLFIFLLDHISIFLKEIRCWWLLQVPFIANYRKEYIEPELNIEDLWKIWEWDEKVLLKSNNFFAASFFAFCPMYIADSELGIITLILIFIVSGASFALVKRTSIVCFKKCRITSLTRSKRVVTSLLMMIQEFCRQRILTGIIPW